MNRLNFKTHNNIDISTPSKSIGISIYWLKNEFSDDNKNLVEQTFEKVEKIGIAPAGKFYRFGNMVNALFYGAEVNSFIRELFQNKLSGVLVDIIYLNDDDEIMSVEVVKNKSEIVIPEKLKESDSVIKKWRSWFNL